MFEKERKEMISLLKQRGIEDENVINAMYSVERHAFVGGAFLPKAYDDSALPIGCAQTISQPYTVALMTEVLHVQRDQKILEIGTGSGYQAAVLSEMGARVFTIERHFELFSQAKKIFEKLGYNIACKAGDGSVGWNEFAPFDGIIVTAGAPEIPITLVKQLNPSGGRMVIPVGDQELQKMIIVTRNGDETSKKEIDGFKFVPLIGKMGWQQ